jgi:hypothetical protein
MDRETLEREYERLSDEELIRMCESGRLTELALDVARKELAQRQIDAPMPPDATEEPLAEPEISGFATVYRTLTLSEAQLINGRLLIEGIPSHVAHEHTLQALGSVMGGFQVRVPLESVVLAKQILSDILSGKLALDDDAKRV